MNENTLLTLVAFNIWFSNHICEMGNNLLWWTNLLRVVRSARIFKSRKSANSEIPSAFFVPFISSKQTKTPKISKVYFLYFLFISVHHYLLATMHFMCKQRRATTIFLISIDAQLLGKERTNERFSGMLIVVQHGIMETEPL